MMSQNSKQELLETIQPRYRKATKSEKQQILDEFVAITGYHRKHAVRILNQWVRFSAPTLREKRTNPRSGRDVNPA